MKIDYPKILKDNMLNVLRDVLINIEKNGLREGHHLFITFITNNKKVIMPSWLKDKFPNEMTIVIQYEYWNFKVFKNYFEITLSFNNIKSNLIIPFKFVISFADPYANFELQLFKKTKNYELVSEYQEKSNNKKIKSKQNNIIEFNKFKKN